MSDEVSTTETEEELRARSTPAQYEVTQRSGTEPAFTGDYWDCHADGMYKCVVCDEQLFNSGTKFESGSGWPSFFQPAEEERVEEVTDSSHGMVRTEVRCSSCGSHLGHVFPDGPHPTGLRYCINDAALNLDPADSES